MSDPTPTFSSRWKRAEELFHEALTVAADQRSAFLDSACGDDRALRADVTRLLAGHERAHEEFLEPVVKVARGSPSSDETAGMPRKIGRYHLKRIIGSGGMGTVYEAVQEQPRRTVAVKVMKRGIASASALRRFEYESQILARLHHPGIAHIHEAGVHDDGTGGVQFFAMEYIPNARSLTDYAREKKLGTHEKLRLFGNVCSAVHHGHQKGIIHRDLKPDNILVDTSGQVKVIDFGVARATDADLAVTTLQTEIGQLIGSVQYMSPEQVEADPHDLDTRSDVYALGVVLYELLTGKLPYDASHVSVFEATKIIREAQPIRMSTHSAALRGDLETIVAHALEKDRERRYQSSDDLRRDLERFLNKQPISARPPSVVYHLRVFARRNRVIVSAAAAVFLVMVAATIVSIAFAVSATRAARAETEALRRSESVTEFLGTILTSASPEYAQGREVTVRQVLDEAALRVATELRDQPLVEAAARRAIGESYQSLGAYDEAEHHLRLALEIEETLHRDVEGVHPHVADAMLSLGSLLLDDHRVNEAEPLFERALEIARQTEGEEHPLTARAMSWIAGALLVQRELPESEAMALRAHEIMRNARGGDHPQTINLYNTWVLAVNNQRRYKEAEPHFRTLLELTRNAFGEDHPDTARAYNNLGWTLNNQAKYAESEEYYRKALDIDRRIRGDKHPHTALVLSNLAGVVMYQGRFEEGEALYRECFTITQELMGDSHTWTASAALGMTWALSSLGRHEEAVEFARKGLELARRATSDGSRLTARAFQKLAAELTALDRVEEAESFLRRSLDIVLASSDKEIDGMALAYNELAFNLSAQGRHAEAEPMFDRALEIRLRLRGPDHPHTLLLMHNAGRIRLEQEKLNEAEPRLLEVLEASKRVLPEGHWHRAIYRMTYGRCLRMLERYEEAETQLLQAHQSLADALGESHERTHVAAEELVMLYEAWGRNDEAARWRDRRSVFLGLPAAIDPGGDHPAA